MTDLSEMDKFERQPICDHCVKEFPYDLANGCAASDWQSTGQCLNGECSCYGTEVDGGLCEGCYLLTK